MKPNRIMPDLQCSLICEDVRQESSGNFILVGVIGLIRVPQVPVFAAKLCVFNRWVAGVGQFTEVTRLLAPDGTTVARQNTVKFQLNDPSQAMTTVSVMQNLEFAHQGVYHLEILVDDVMKLRIPLPVVVVPPPAGAPGAPGAPRPSGQPAPGMNPIAPQTPPPTEPPAAS
jgi:hypothetical protein